MLTTVTAGSYTIRGISVGGVYTSLLIPELSTMLDVGAAPRSFAGVNQLFLSHGHVDHAGALSTFLGLRALSGRRDPLRVFMPAEIVDHMMDALRAMSAMQRWELAIEPVGMVPKQEHVLKGDLRVRAFRTFHPVPSLGYSFFRRINKLRPEFADLPGDEIGARRKAGDDIFDSIERGEIAYATDTLPGVLEAEPWLYESGVLILECTFLDERKSIESAHAGCHIHLDDLIELADRFDNQHIVLMHFSQLYHQDEIRGILQRRCPPNLLSRIVPFVSDARDWPG